MVGLLPWEVGSGAQSQHPIHDAGHRGCRFQIEAPTGVPWRAGDPPAIRAVCCQGSCYGPNPALNGGSTSSGRGE